MFWPGVLSGGAVLDLSQDLRLRSARAAVGPGRGEWLPEKMESKNVSDLYGKEFPWIIYRRGKSPLRIGQS